MPRLRFPPDQPSEPESPELARIVRGYRRTTQELLAVALLLGAVALVLATVVYQGGF